MPKLEAFELASKRKGPVLLDVPMNIQKNESRMGLIDKTKTKKPLKKVFNAKFEKQNIKLNELYQKQKDTCSCWKWSIPIDTVEDFRIFLVL